MRNVPEPHENGLALRRGKCGGSFVRQHFETLLECRSAPVCIHSIHLIVAVPAPAVKKKSGISQIRPEKFCGHRKTFRALLDHPPAFLESMTDISGHPLRH